MSCSSPFRFFASTTGKWEANVENVVNVGQFLLGLGVFFVGIGTLYGVSVWDKKNKGS
jgi:hypothetical protein